MAIHHRNRTTISVCRVSMSLSPQLLHELDAAVKSSFQSLRDEYFLDLIICTIAVVIGVAIEEVEYFLSWRSVRTLLPLRILLPKHRIDTVARRTSKVGWLLIIVGVAGEGVYEARVARADGWLQEFNNILFTAQGAAINDLGTISARARDDSESAIKQSGMAVGNSKKAEVEASNALELARGARREADSFEKRIVSATDTAIKAETHLSEALRKASEAEAHALSAAQLSQDASLKGLEIEGKLADRDFTDGQRYRMLAVLRSSPIGKQTLNATVLLRRKVAIQSLLSEGGEALGYAIKIAGIFRSAGWDVTDPDGRGMFSIPLKGAAIVVAKDGVERSLIEFIGSALIVGGVGKGPIPVSTDEKKPGGTLEVWVGSK